MKYRILESRAKSKEGMKDDFLENFIHDAVKKAKEESGMERICINGIGQFFPNFFEDAVECCILNTAYWENPEIIERYIKENFG